MFFSLVLLALGLAFLIGGADVLVRGVSLLAGAMRIPPLAIGLTVVAFGTSAPELVLNTMSAAQGETGLAFGNIVGSCTMNIGFVLAISAIVHPLAVGQSLITQELPMMVLGVAAAALMCADRLLSGATPGCLSRSDGIALLLLFSVFLYHTIRAASIVRTADPLVAQVQAIADRKAEQAQFKPSRLRAATLLTLFGLAGVAAGGRLAVAASVDIATVLKVPVNVIGLTLVSFGTTLPELTTSLLAARRGQADIAIGNVVGSNIFNILFIAGLVATINPIAVPAGSYIDLIFLAALSTALLPVAIRGPRRITRGEGAGLLFAYLVFLSYRMYTAVPPA